ncbi:hypothetical protein GT352_03085 [Streptomyces sp. SID1046]|uniref:hypothetical protein n=1 Tax=Streptomyces sp. SID1046 TaxID=2690249 RepID=UPI00136A6259|nr:hypothetical protein [Streptomyces sp. SID1046]MYV72943.1 hypothetical protein [Streptomyces sp. SID1046]
MTHAPAWRQREVYALELEPGLTGRLLLSVPGRAPITDLARFPAPPGACAAQARAARLGYADLCSLA